MGKNKGKQLDLSKRKVLAQGLEDGKTATAIARSLGCHKSTVSREVLKYRYLSFKGEDRPSLCSTCSKNQTCTLRHRCGRMTCSAKCVGCKSLEVCDKYVKIKCHRDNRFPYVCVNCPFINSCKKNHYLYSPEKANEAALIIRRESREGLNMNEEQYRIFDETILNGNRKGQSLYHIQKSNNLGRCLKSIYNYSHQGKISVRPIDLPRVVTLKVRKVKTPKEYEYEENKSIDRTGHLYSDWLIYQAKKRIIVYWEMDFLGAVHDSEQTIMTLTIPQFEFVYLKVFDSPKKEDVLAFFKKLIRDLGDDFSVVFEAIITDRDPRFNCFREIEIDEDAEVKTRIFFCNPGASNEKPSVENLNQQIRVIFPKGCLLSNITQELCDEISSNLNSRYLDSVDDKRPLDLFTTYFGEEIYKKLNLKVVSPEEVRILKYNKY